MTELFDRTRRYLDLVAPDEEAEAPEDATDARAPVDGEGAGPTTPDEAADAGGAGASGDALAPEEDAAAGGRVDEGPPPAGISLEDACDLLAVARRRHVIDLLVDGPQPLQTLALRIARVETGERTPSERARRRVWITLYQSHLPKLAAHGVVAADWDTDEDQPIRPGPAYAVMRTALDDLHARFPDSVAEQPPPA